MLVLEFKAYGKSSQFSAIDDAIRTAQFIRNKALRLWMGEPNISKYDLSKYCAELAKEFPFANELNSMARQAAAERAWASIRSMSNASGESTSTLAGEILSRQVGS